MLTDGLGVYSRSPKNPAVARELQIGLYDPAEADWSLFGNSWPCGMFGRTAVLLIQTHPTEFWMGYRWALDEL